MRIAWGLMRNYIVGRKDLEFGLVWIKTSYWGVRVVNRDVVIRAWIEGLAYELLPWGWGVSIQGVGALSRIGWRPKFQGLGRGTPLFGTKKQTNSLSLWDLALGSWMKHMQVWWGRGGMMPNAKNLPGRKRAWAHRMEGSGYAWKQLGLSFSPRLAICVECWGAGGNATRPGGSNHRSLNEGEVKNWYQNH